MKPLKISHLGFGFVGLVGVMAVTLATYMTHELDVIADSIQARERVAATQEVMEALQSLDASTRRLAHDLAEWDEARQQLAFSEFYELWRDTRVKDSGIVPASVDTVALYDKHGHILRPGHAYDPMPLRIDIARTPMYLLLSGDAPQHGHAHLAYFLPVQADPSGTVLLGYVGIKLDLLAELGQNRHYRFADITGVNTPTAMRALDQLGELAGSIRYEVRPNASVQLVREVFQKELVQMLVFVIVILSLASYFLHRMMIRPLLAISREIDALQGAVDHGGGALLAGANMPVAELENVRRSFNNYRSRLVELHHNLEQNSRDFYDQAHHDALTSVYNRRAFEEDWRDADLGRGSGRCALLLFDCDHFKAINDTYGHAVGDEVIKAIAQGLERALRTGDKLYRLGGDEFATLLPEADLEKAKAVAERCLEQVRAHDFRQHGMNEPASISIGIAHCEDTGGSMDLSELQKRADLAMYAAKRPGSGHIVCYHPELGGVAALVANPSVHGVFQAIQDPTLVRMLYQTIVRLPGVEPDYVEALARIRFENRLLGPGDIFPIVQGRRLDAEFDLAIIRAVERDMGSARLKPGLGVSINVSAPGIVHARVVEALLALRRKAPERKLVVEITETALITQMEVASAHIEKLRAAGCLVALDDFGSGYSSLRYLSSMPVDLVKFDLSMTRLLEHPDPKQRQITAEVAAMVRNAGYRIVAEGIETQTLLDRVAELGFDYAQGYFFGRPE